MTRAPKNTRDLNLLTMTIGLWQVNQVAKPQCQRLNESRLGLWFSVGEFCGFMS